jgi:hypothetical protein
MIFKKKITRISGMELLMAIAVDVWHRYKDQTRTHMHTPLRLHFGNCGVCAAVVLNDDTRGVVAETDAILNAATGSSASKVTPNKSVPSTVGVNNLLGVDGDDLDGARGGRGCVDGGLGALSKDHQALTCTVVRECGSLLRDFGDILSAKTLDGGEHLGLIVVRKDNVHVGKDLLELLAEELDNEGGGKVHHEQPTNFAATLGDGQDEVNVNGEGEASEVEEARLQLCGLDVGRVNVLRRNQIGSSEVGDEGALFASDAHGTAAGGGSGGGLDKHANTILLSCFLQDLTVFVVCGAANVRDEGLGGGLCDPLGNASSVEAGTAGDVADALLLLKFGVDAHLLRGNQRSSSGLDIVLGKELSANMGGDVKQGVALDVELLEGHDR